MIFWDVLPTQTILPQNMIWFDDFQDWSLSNVVDGVNKYHGFFEGSKVEPAREILSRSFIFNDQGYCNISFSLVFGCDVENNDAVNFKITHNNTIILSNKFILNKAIFLYINDSSIFDASCQASDCDIFCQDGGYQVSYSYALDITSNIANDLFMVRFEPEFDSGVGTNNEYYGVYDFRIYCQPDSVSPTTNTVFPSITPTIATNKPTRIPTSQPTNTPTDTPTSIPTSVPSDSPTIEPIPTPTEAPTITPTVSPSVSPISTTNNSSANPTATPSLSPSISPTTPTVTGAIGSEPSSLVMIIIY